MGIKDPIGSAVADFIRPKVGNEIFGYLDPLGLFPEEVKMPDYGPPPKPPVMQEPVSERRRKINSGRGSTLLTRPSGLGSPVISYTPTLLGQ